MAKELSNELVELLAKRTFVHLATRMDDGSPQVSPVWVDVDRGCILVNSAKGRLKDRNMRSDPRVALSVTDPENPYQGMMVRGRVVEITEDGADDHIDKMASKYLGKDRYPFRGPGEVRVKYYIEADRIARIG